MIFLNEIILYCCVRVPIHLNFDFNFRKKIKHITFRLLVHQKGWYFWLNYYTINFTKTFFCWTEHNHFNLETPLLSNTKQNCQMLDMQCMKKSVRVGKRSKPMGFMYTNVSFKTRRSSRIVSGYSSQSFAIKFSS